MKKHYNITVGDVVSVLVNNDNILPQCHVLYTPASDNDSWHLREVEKGQLHYMQSYSVMSLVEKCEDVAAFKARAFEDSL